MYVEPNFQTKAELKRAVEAGEVVICYSAGLEHPNAGGDQFVEGPHYPQPHRWWYAKVRLDENCHVVRVCN